MILTIDEIKSIILDDTTPAYIKRGQDYNKTMRLHLYGEGLDTYVEKIKDYETQSLFNLRAKYSRSNKDVFSRLARPMDKVFSAKGGSIYYNLQDTQEKQARLLSFNVKNGVSIRKWIETNWLAHMKDDPFGLIFLEILPEQQARIAKQKGQSFVYPTYKSITSIKKYETKGSGLEWVQFEVTNSEKVKAGYKPEQVIYRLVDDSKDYWVEKLNGEEIRILTNQTFDNYFGEVPAILNSDIQDPQNEGCVLSFFDDALELAENYFLDGSIRITHKIMHGFPKYWELADDCTTCAGARYKDGEECPDCKGTGKRLMLKVSDAKLLPYPDKDNPSPAPNVAGYVSPDEIYFKISSGDMQMLEQMMNITVWGANSALMVPKGMSVDASGQPKTATEVMSDIKPQADRLAIISEMAEKRHKFILDGVVRLQVAMNYQGSSVNYGRRYMIEGPDEIWDKYSKARLSGSPISVLEDLLIEYYEAKYQGDEISLAVAKKLMYVEPFVHMTAKDVELLTMVTQEDKAAKTYFGEWLSQQNEAMILSMSAELLREQLNTFATEKAQAVQDHADKQMQKEQQFKKPMAA